MKNFDKRKILFASLSIIWFSLCAVGFALLVDYGVKPGELGTPPEAWPLESKLVRAQEQPTLIMFAHPRCPCTQAGMSELAELMAHIKGKASINVVFHKPEKFDRKWAEGSLYERAKSLTPDNVVIDETGLEVGLFKPKTSGQVYLFDKNGALVYSGGITPSRGHEGDNLGSQRIMDFVLNGKKIEKKFSVYGCSLFHNGSHFKEKKTISKIGSHPHEH